MMALTRPVWRPEAAKASCWRKEAPLQHCNFVMLLQQPYPAAALGGLSLNACIADSGVRFGALLTLLHAPI
jgi:hypothetical protein